MAKKRGVASEYRNQATDRSVEFANVRLGEESKEQFEGWSGSIEEAFADTLMLAVNDGWKISMKYDDNNRCYMVSFTQGRFDDINRNIIVTSRAGDVEEAALMCVFKIYVMFAKQRLPVSSTEYGWG